MINERINEYTFDEIETGQTEAFTRKITLEMEDAFRHMTGDLNPLHREDDFACQTGGGKFKGHIAFGMLTASLLSTLAGVYLPGKYSLIHSIDNIQFRKPVYAGDVLTVTGTVREKQDGLKLLLLAVKAVNQDNQTVLKADMKVLVQK